MFSLPMNSDDVTVLFLWNVLDHKMFSLLFIHSHKKNTQNTGMIWKVRGISFRQWHWFHNRPKVMDKYLKVIRSKGQCRDRVYLFCWSLIIVHIPLFCQKFCNWLWFVHMDYWLFLENQKEITSVVNYKIAMMVWHFMKVRIKFIDKFWLLSERQENYEFLKETCKERMAEDEANVHNKQKRRIN